MLTNLRFRFVGFSRFLFVVFLIVYTTKWQKTFDEIEQSLLEARFLANETLNTYVLQQIGPTEWKRSRSTFFRLCPSVSNCELVPPFIHYESRQMIAPSYGVATCVIYKNMSTILTAIMCYLYDALTYRRQVKDLTHDTYNVRFCKGKNEFNSIRSLASFRNSTTGMKLTWLNILVSRNPLERFISGFINKCIR
ncbi:hypothetical protein DICVIV_04069 [Dictyocaulus viviparus]|uniref:Uncharacterized protein n=1 Tax=Dictyocaulus viviparus TaxID=29172 RepID=A0A0D8Y5I2_DICVI|nr:hypothetical protein DICVIV_04069 [Dictyocaulus viviparus]